MFESISNFLNTQKNALCEANHRMAVVFHTGKNQPDLNDFINRLSYHRKLVVSSLIKNALIPEKAITQLGEEYDCVVFDARCDFNSNALAAIAGVLCGGGCLLIILPELELWKKNSSLFLRHVESLLRNQVGVFYFNPLNINPDVKTITHNSLSVEKNSPYRTEDQKHVVNCIFSDLQTSCSYCGVLISGRGRGKTTALGFVAGKLLPQKSIKLLITAPRLSIIAPLFQQVNKQCKEQGTGNLVLKKSAIKMGASSLCFIAPDELLHILPEADVLFVDEAAAIPLFMLEQFLAHYPKIIFSTTTHGYEGTGRGFVLKFFKRLDQIKPDWKKLELQQPIRWSLTDPLEPWVESLLFLNLKPQSVPVFSTDDPIDFSKVVVTLLGRNHLLEDKKKLTAVFSLLIFSHYRTSPSDFQYLLDSDNIRLYALQYKGCLLGVLVVNQEGDFNEALSQAIYRGERRPQGHLLPQTLCFHGGCEAAARLKYARIMRIAIQPEYRRQGLGCFLLKQVIAHERMAGMDIIGSSFSVTSSLLLFWQGADLALLRIGFSRDHVTASHSVVVAKALTPAGEKITRYLRLKFYQHIMLWLQGPLAALSADLKAQILLALPEKRPEISDAIDLDDVTSFANFSRNYEACMPAIHRFIEGKLALSQSALAVLTDAEKKMLVLSAAYMNDWSAIVKAMQLKQYNVSGKKQAQKLLRSALKSLLDAENL